MSYISGKGIKYKYKHLQVNIFVISRGLQVFQNYNIYDFYYRKILKKTQNYLNQLEKIASFNYGSWTKVYEDIRQKQKKIDCYST